MGRPWAFALDADFADAESTMTFGNRSYVPGDAAFNRSRPLCHIKAMIRSLPGWVEKNNGAALPPASPACKASASQCGAPEEALLVPHGTTALRIGAMPLSGYVGITAQTLYV